MPCRARRLEEHEGAVDVGLDELTRSLEGAVDVGLRGEVHDHVDSRGELGHQRRVDDVALDETEAGVVAHRVEVARVARIGELVEDGHPVACVLAQGHAHELAADEPRPAGHQEMHNDP